MDTSTIADKETRTQSPETVGLGLKPWTPDLLVDQPAAKSHSYTPVSSSAKPEIKVLLSGL